MFANLSDWEVMGRSGNAFASTARSTLRVDHALTRATFALWIQQTFVKLSRDRQNRPAA